MVWEQIVIYFSIGDRVGGFYFCTHNNDSDLSQFGFIMSCQFMSCHVMSCHVMSCHVMSCHVMSCHVMSCHVMSCHVMSCHVMSCHVMSCPSSAVEFSTNPIIVFEMLPFRRNQNQDNVVYTLRGSFHH